jgi:hypothetical protein
LLGVELAPELLLAVPPSELPELERQRNREMRVSREFDACIVGARAAKLASRQSFITKRLRARRSERPNVLSIEFDDVRKGPASQEFEVGWIGL